MPTRRSAAAPRSISLARLSTVDMITFCMLAQHQALLAGGSSLRLLSLL